MATANLIFSQAMELGGVERGLLGLLDSIDYDRYDVDLFFDAAQRRIDASPRFESQSPAGDSAVCVSGCSDDITSIKRTDRCTLRATKGKTCSPTL